MFYENIFPLRSNEKQDTQVPSLPITPEFSDDIYDNTGNTEGEDEVDNNHLPIDNKGDNPQEENGQQQNEAQPTRYSTRVRKAPRWLDDYDINTCYIVYDTEEPHEGVEGNNDLDTEICPYKTPPCI